MTWFARPHNGLVAWEVTAFGVTMFIRNASGRSFEWRHRIKFTRER